MTSKRKDPFWRLPGAIQHLPDGAEIREESIGADHVLLHVTFPDDTDVERISQFARNFTKEMPKNVRAIFTMEGIEIKVKRPRSVSLQMVNNRIDSEALLSQIKGLIEDNDITNVNLHIQGNDIFAPEVRVGPVGIPAKPSNLVTKKPNEVVTVTKKVKLEVPCPACRGNGKVNIAGQTDICGWCQGNALVEDEVAKEYEAKQKRSEAAKKAAATRAANKKKGKSNGQPRKRRSSRQAKDGKTRGGSQKKGGGRKTKTT